MQEISLDQFDQYTWILLLLIAGYYIYKQRQRRSFKQKAQSGQNKADVEVQPVINEVERNALRAKLLEKAVIREDINKESNEREKQKSNKRLRKTIGYSYAPFVVFALIYAFGNISTAFIILLVGLFMAVPIGLVLGALMNGRSRFESKNWYLPHYKKEILPELLQAIDPNATYERRGLNSEQFFNIGIFVPSSNFDFSSEDEIKMTKDEVRVTFTEAAYTRRINRNDASKRYKGSKERIFKGLLMEAELNKRLEGRTFMVPDFTDSASTSGKIEGFVKTAIGAGNAHLVDFSLNQERVNLEDPDFEKFFNVYSNDQVESRYIFTPTFMERVKDFKNRAGDVIYMALHGGKVYVLVDWNKDLFEPPPLGTTPEAFVDKVLPTLEDLELILHLVEALKLNQNLWK